MMRRTTTAILATTGVLALAFMPQASAQDPALGGYGAGAQATAMQLSILDQFEAAFSVTGATVAGEPAKAAANGAAALITGASEEMTTAATPGDPASAQSCLVDEAIPAPLDLAALEIACVDMTTDGAPSGASASDELGLVLTSPEAAAQLLDALAPALDQVLAGLEPVLTELDAEQNVADVVDLVLTNVAGGSTFAEVTVGSAHSQASKVAGSSGVESVTVALLPDLTVGETGIGPLAEITIGTASAQAAYDAASGSVVTAGEAAVIDIDLAGLEALVDALGQQIKGIIDGLLPAELSDPLIGSVLDPVLDGVGTIVEALDTEIEAGFNTTVDQLACTGDNPLAPVLCFVAGGVNELDAEEAKALGYDFGPTTKGIEAQVLDLALLSAAGEQPLLGLRIGGASAAAAAVPAAPVAPSTPEETSRTLPETGAESGLPVALALLAVAALGGTLVRRSRTA